MVYVIRDADGGVFYVGYTTNLYRRLEKHRRTGLLNESRTVTVVEGGKDTERMLIQQYLPRGNYQHSVVLRRRLWQKSIERQLDEILDSLRDPRATGGSWNIMSNPDWWPEPFTGEPRLVP